MATAAPLLSFTEMATSLSELHQAHAHMLKTGLTNDTFASSRLITMAAALPHTEAIAYAHSIFARTPDPNSYMWNTMIRAYANSPTPDHSVVLFHQMLYGPVPPDKFTFTFGLKACSSLRGIEEGKQIHAHLLKIGIGHDAFIQNTLIHLYAITGCTAIARNLLDRMLDSDVISWNAILSAYTEMGLMNLALSLFDEMPDRNSESWNFMISGYVGIGLIEEAIAIFDQMPTKNVVSYNAIITGYMRKHQFSQIFLLFEDMQSKNVKPDNCTLVNILTACAHTGALSQGEWIHTYIEKNGLCISGYLATALVDMYSKCGCIEKALKVFNNCSKKDISTWNSMISGLSIHGYGQEALTLFAEMTNDGSSKPNEVTFISILSACSRSNLLNEGRKFFDLMINVYEIKPTIEHYGCMVDLLGRAGMLEEAEKLVIKMPLKESPLLWESLLSACRNYGNMKLGERVAGTLLKLDPGDSAVYVQLSNMYAYMGRWKDVMDVRRKMRNRQVVKEPGCSMIEVNGVVHEFLAGEGLIC